MQEKHFVDDQVEWDTLLTQEYDPPLLRGIAPVTLLGRLSRVPHYPHPLYVAHYVAHHPHPLYVAHYPLSPSTVLPTNLIHYVAHYVVSLGNLATVSHDILQLVAGGQ